MAVGGIGGFMIPTIQHICTGLLMLVSTKTVKNLLPDQKAERSLHLPSHGSSLTSPRSPSSSFKWFFFRDF